MTVNKDEIRKSIEAATPIPWHVTKGVTYRVQFSDADAYLIANAPAWISALLASDDANAETIRQQAEDLDAMRRMAVKWEQKADKLAKQNAQQAAKIERLEIATSIDVSLGNTVCEMQADIVAKDEEIARLREIIETAIYELEQLERVLDMPERGYVRNGYNSVLRTLRELDRKDTQPAVCTCEGPAGSQHEIGCPSYRDTQPETRDDTCGECWTRGPHRRVGDGWECVKCNPVEDTQPHDEEAVCEDCGARINPEKPFDEGDRILCNDCEDTQGEGGHESR
jgi:hypothetical protein